MSRLKSCSPASGYRNWFARKRLAPLFFFAAVLASVVLALPRPAWSADTTESIWSGTTSTNWATSTNWGNGVPSTTVSAEFNSAFTNQPTLTGTSTSEGIWVTGSSTTGNLGLTTISGPFGLTITGNATLDGNTNVGIVLDGVANNSLTINNTVTGVTTTNSTSFLVNNAGTLTIAAPLMITAGTTLTLGSNATTGAGSLIISGAIQNTTGAVTVNDTAGTTVVTLSGNNLETGTTTVTAGAPAGHHQRRAARRRQRCRLNGGVLDLANASGTNLSFGRNTTVGGNTQITSDLLSGTAGNIYTLGTLSIGAQALTFAGGTTASETGTAGVTFGATILTATGTAFTVNNPTGTGSTAVTLLTLGSVTGTATSFTVNGTGNTNITGIIGTTTGSVTMGGSGTLTLSGQNTYTGNTIINSGTLTLSVSSGTAVSPSSVLVLGGGTLSDADGSGGAGETFSSTTINPGSSTVSTSNTNVPVLQLDALSRTVAGGTVDFVPASQSPTNPGSIATITGNNTAGILGGWATVNGTSWATAPSGTIQALTSYNVTLGGVNLSDSTTTNNDILSATGTTTLTGAVTVNTLNFNTTGALANGGFAVTLGLGGTNGPFGGLLVTANGGTISGTGIVGAGAANEFIVNTASGDTLAISSPIIGAGAGSLTKAGPGTLILSGTSAYTGGTTINAGTLSISTDLNLGAAPGAPATNITLNGGTLQITAATADPTRTINTNRSMTLGALGATINVAVAASGSFNLNTETAVIYTGAISGSGNLTVTGGISTNSNSNPYLLELGGSNVYTGTTTVNNATVGFLNSGTAFSNALPTTTVLNLGTNGRFIMNNGAGNQTIAGLTSVDSTAQIGCTNTGTTATLTINPGAGQSYTFNGVIGPVTVLDKTGTNTRTALTISGPGTEILAGANTFTGATTLTSGTLTTTNANSLVTASALSLGGGALDIALASGTANLFANNTTVTANSTIIADLLSGTAGNTYTLGTLAIGAQTLTVGGGAAANETGTAGLTFGADPLGDRHDLHGEQPDRRRLDSYDLAQPGLRDRHGHQLHRQRHGQHDDHRHHRHDDRRHQCQRRHAQPYEHRQHVHGQYHRQRRHERAYLSGFRWQYW